MMQRRPSPAALPTLLQLAEWSWDVPPLPAYTMEVESESTTAELQIINEPR